MATGTAAAMAIMATIITGTAVIMNENRAPRSILGPVMRTVLAVLMVGEFSLTAGSADQRSLDAFAKCLAGKNATVYGSFMCPHCDDQRKLFGPSFRYVPYIECSVRGSRQMTFPCVAAQIRYTPTWIFDDGERRVGLQPLKILSEKTGCALP